MRLLKIFRQKTQKYGFFLARLVKEIARIVLYLLFLPNIKDDPVACDHNPLPHPGPKNKGIFWRGEKFLISHLYF
jgi:hypothetical protein